MNKKLLIIVAIATQCMFPKLNFAQAPTLGATSTFSVFTAVGAIDILGTSTIWGDVGTNVGAYTKAASSTIYGSIHNADATSASAATDVATVYSDLASRTCDVTIAGTSSLGTLRKTLGPDTVFCLGGAQTLDSDLTLDAKGDPSAIFIIQIDGALSTNTSSRVLLANSASFCNVFWQINGAVNLGVNSLFRGTIVANGAISLLDGVNLDGRAFTQAGAIALNNNQVVGCDAIGVALPLNLVSFAAQNVNANVHLHWVTASEFNNDYFLIQRTQDGIIIEDVLKVTSAGSSSITSQYSAIDYHPLIGTSFYRLKQTDFDGNSVYSKYISLKSNKISETKIYPNPFKTSTTISIAGISQLTKCEIWVYNVIGEQVMRKSIDKLNTDFVADSLLSGVYFYKIINAGKIFSTGRMMVDR